MTDKAVQDAFDFIATILSVAETGRRKPEGLSELKADDAVAVRVRIELDVIGRVLEVDGEKVRVVANVGPLKGGGVSPLTLDLSRDQIAAIARRETWIN